MDERAMALSVGITFNAVDYNGLMQVKIKTPCNQESILDVVEGINSATVTSNDGLLMIEISGKNMQRDTTIAPDGSVMLDKHIYVTQVQINGLVFDSYDVNDLLFPNYVGNNTTLTIDLPQDRDLIRWYLRLKEKFYAARKQ